MVLGYDFQRLNMLYNGEGPLAAEVTRGGTPAPADGTGSDGFTNWFVFPAPPTAAQFVYAPYPGMLANSIYNISVHVRMDDGTAPKPGDSTDATADFSLVVNGGTTLNSYVVTNLGGGLYRVSIPATVTALNIPANNGVVRYLAQSGKGFKVTGYQITYGAALLPYEYQGAGQPVMDRSVIDNQMPNSEAFDLATHSKVRSSVTANAATAPDGTLTADKLVEDATATQTHYLFVPFTPVSTSAVYTFSIYLKAGERPGANLQLYTGGPSAYFNLSAGTLVSKSALALDAGIVSAGNGWYRAWVTGLWASAAPSQARVDMGSSATSSATVYTGDGVSGLYLWGLMYNSGGLLPYERSRLQNTMGATTSGTYVDAADPLFIPQGLRFDGVDDFLTVLNPPVPSSLSGMTVLCVQTRTTAAGAFTGIWSATSASWYPRLLTTTTTPPQVIYQPTSDTVNSVTAGQVTLGVPFFAAAVSEPGGGARLSVNGAPSVRTAGAGFPIQGISQIGVGARSANTYWWGGTIHAFYVYNRALSDAEITQAYRALKQQLGRRGVPLP